MNIPTAGKWRRFEWSLVPTGEPKTCSMTLAPLRLMLGSAIPARTSGTS